MRALLFIVPCLLTASCLVQTEPVPGPPGKQGPKGDDGKDGAPGTVDTSALSELESRIKELENAAYCPRLVDKEGRMRAYVPDLGVPGLVQCDFGADQMVKVGNFWIDQFEAVLVDDERYGADATCAQEGKFYGSTGGAFPVDDYPPGFPDNGQWNTPVRACSIAGVIPSRTMTYFQAQQACALVGKRLCRNDEWQTAVAGTLDAGSTDGSDGSCVTNASGPRTTGSANKCRSVYGAEDMIGNVAEWVGDWTASSGTEALGSCMSGTWGATYGDDETWNICGTASATDSGGYGQRLPAVAIRGAHWTQGTGAGAFAFDVSAAPSDYGPKTGLRCCASGK